MKQLFLTVGVIGVCGALAYYTFTHPGRDRVEQLRAEYESLRDKNEQLEKDNEQRRREIVALRNDPRLAARRARRQAGLARPNELILQFEGEEGADRNLQVELSVGGDGMRVAGEPVALEELDERLQKLREEFSEARLRVDFDDEVGALRRERVIDIVDDSPFSATAAKRLRH